MAITFDRNTVLVGDATVADVVTRAYRRMEAIDMAEAPSDTEMSNGVTALQEMFDSWGHELPELTEQVFLGSTTSGDPTVTFTDAVMLADDLNVSGTGIAASTTIASVTNTKEIELSANATASGTVDLTFSPVPFPVRHRAGITALLAVYMAGDTGLPDAPARVADDADKGWTRLLADYMPDNKTVFDRVLIQPIVTWDINSG